eukprot:7613762-Karenia_brevis.AAC.1
MVKSTEWPDRRGWRRLPKSWDPKVENKTIKAIGHYQKCGSWWKFSVVQLKEGVFDRWAKGPLVSKTDLRIICQKCPDAGHAWVVKLQPHLGGKCTRADLIVMTDVLPWWGRNPYMMRLAGWYFLNESRHLSWDEYQSGYWEGRKWVYSWRVHHLFKGDAENIVLSKLKLITVEEDKAFQAAEW